MADAHVISLRPAATPGAAPLPTGSARLMYPWRDAVWASDLSATDKLVALAYADHASSGILTVWVTPERLQARTSLGRTATTAALRRLRDAGWLAVTTQGHRGSVTRYALTLPGGVAEQRPDSGFGDPESHGFVSSADELVSPRDELVSADDPDPLTHPSPHPTNRAPAPDVDDEQGQEDDVVGLVEEIRSHSLAVGLTATATRTHAASLRTAGWTRQTLAAELRGQDFTGARGPGLLRYRLAALATSTPPQPVVATPAAERGPSSTQRLLAEHEAQAAARPASPETIAAVRAAAHRRIAA
ncbi:hypothetical protein ACFWGN_20625 [Oerskovia sp. NPDC060338]|uniref:hypothetical protein n=1 Tax=Oerskovia sp. NPDC060338 TaxID=3347100 RepID=UPI0036690033